MRDRKERVTFVEIRESAFELGQSQYVMLVVEASNEVSNRIGSLTFDLERCSAWHLSDQLSQPTSRIMKMSPAAFQAEDKSDRCR